MKTCTKCRESKPLSGFSRDARAADGLYSSCKACNAAYYAAHAAIACAREKSRREADPEKARRQSAEWRRANPEKSRAAIVRWERAHPDRGRARDAKHHAAHPDARRIRNARWVKANPESVIASKHRRRALVLNAPGGGVTTEQWDGILTDSLGLCVYCNERRSLEMEHVEPLSRGGAHDPENIAAACAPCNRSKNDTKLVVWMARRAASRTLAQAA